MKRCKHEIILGIFIPVLFLIAAIFLKSFFGENAYPVDYEYIDSYDWAGIFFGWYCAMTFVCILINALLIPILGVKANINSQNAWLTYLIINIIVSLIAPIYITFAFREDSLCSVIMYILFILQYLTTFIVSSYKCPRHWDFFPTK